jgi:hypothetical protein
MFLFLLHKKKLNSIICLTLDLNWLSKTNKKITLLYKQEKKKKQFDFTIKSKLNV